MTGAGGDGHAGVAGGDALLDEQVAYYRARAPEYDSWFFRAGRYDPGPEETAVWFAEVEEVRDALAAVPINGGDVLELAGGTGLWTSLLARRAARVTVVDASPEMIARNRARLGAEGRRAEYVEHDLFTWRPTRRWDAVFFGFWVSHVPHARLDGFLATVADALRPGGRVFLVDSRGDRAPATADDERPGAREDTVTRRLEDGREFRIVKIYWEPAELERRASAAGLDLAVSTTPRHFLYGVGRRR